MCLCLALSAFLDVIYKDKLKRCYYRCLCFVRCVYGSFMLFRRGGRFLIAARILHSHDIGKFTVMLNVLIIHQDCKNGNPSVIFRLRDSPRIIVIMLHELRKNVYKVMIKDVNSNFGVI